MIIKLVVIGILLVGIEVGAGLINAASFRVPSFTLLLAIYCGVRWGADIGAVTGFIMGMLMGLLRFEPLGGSALVGTLVGFSAGYFYGKLYIGQYFTLLIIAGLLLFLAELIQGGVSLLLFGNIIEPDLLWIGVTMACSVPLFYVLELVLRPSIRSRYLMFYK